MHSPAINATTAIRVLTMSSLAGLLFAVGLRLNGAELVAALRRGRLRCLLPTNFLLVPLVALAVARALAIPTPIAVGMLLLAAAPFAPVVPIFTRMAKGDVALAGTLTALFPFFSAFLTPWICQLSLRALRGAGDLKFDVLANLAVLVSTITLPLLAGVAFAHWLPRLGRRLLRPLEVVSEAIGAISLGFVTLVESRLILSTGWKALLAMAVVGELSFLAGYHLSGPAVSVRRVTALGASNRNIALALLIAIESFADTPVVAAVTANGLLLIFLGLLHVAYWRFLKPAPDPDRN